MPHPYKVGTYCAQAWLSVIMLLAQSTAASCYQAGNQDEASHFNWQMHCRSAAMHDSVITSW